MNRAAQNRSPFQAYLTLCKPRVVLLMLITAWVGMVLAIPKQVPLSLWPWLTMVLGTMGIALAASCGAVINHFIERKLDARMARTVKRPLPMGQVTAQKALYFACCLGGAGLLILAVFVNAVATGLTFASLVGYACIYTVFLKPATPQNIVIGGLAGAMPPLLGWTVITPHIHADALLLVFIIFAWTPPHFWALAIDRYKDYEKINLPMLPITHGIPFTKLTIVLYTLLMIAATLLPFASGMQGMVYLIGLLPINAIFLYYALRLYYSDDGRFALNTFWYSIIYLFLLFGLMLVDHLW